MPAAFGILPVGMAGLITMINLKLLACGGILALSAATVAIPTTSGTFSANAYGSCYQHDYYTGGVKLWTLSAGYSASAGFGALDAGAVASVYGYGTLLVSKSASSGWLVHPTGDSISVSDSAANTNAPYGTPYNVNTAAQVLGGLSPGEQNDNANGSCSVPGALPL